MVDGPGDRVGCDWFRVAPEGLCWMAPTSFSEGVCFDQRFFQASDARYDRDATMSRISGLAR